MTITVIYNLYMCFYSDTFITTHLSVLILFLKDLLRFIFREAKIHNAIIFFDECEPIFESRENRPNLSLALMLTEVGVVL